MDLTAALLRRTRPSLFLITGVGGTACRLAVERVIREQGYRQALSPAEANLLITCGSLQGGLDDAADRVWDQLPLPRGRVHLTDVGDTAPGLDRALSELTDVQRQRRGVRTPAPVSRPVSMELMASEGHATHHMSGMDMDKPVHDMSGHDMSGMEMDKPAHDMSGMDKPGHDMSGMDKPAHDISGADHAGHDMSGMEMPGGLAMAERAPDRDGLSLDQLHVPFGPALPDWPVGLCLRLVIQGDVVQDARVEVIGDGETGAPFWTAELSRPAALDSLQRLLSVAGWPTAALIARRLRDILLTDPTATARWLRWLELAAAPDPAVPAAHDLRSRADAAREILDALPGLLVGQELAAVRLIVASLDPDLEAMAAGSARRGGHA